MPEGLLIKEDFAESPYGQSVSDVTIPSIPSTDTDEEEESSMEHHKSSKHSMKIDKGFAPDTVALSMEDLKALSAGRGSGEEDEEEEDDGEMLSGVSTSLPCHHVRFHPGRSVFDVTHTIDAQLQLARRPWAIRVGVAASNAVLYLLSIYRGESEDDVSEVSRNGNSGESAFGYDDALRMLRLLSPHTLLFHTYGNIHLADLTESFDVLITPTTSSSSSSSSSSSPTSPVSVHALRWQGSSIYNRSQGISPSALEQSCLHSLALTVFDAYTGILPFSEATAQHAAELVSGGGVADITPLTSTDESLGAIVAAALKSSHSPTGGDSNGSHTGNSQAMIHFRDSLSALIRQGSGTSHTSSDASPSPEASESERNPIFRG